jgi:hypothetical protein
MGFMTEDLYSIAWGWGQDAAADGADVEGGLMATMLLSYHGLPAEMQSALKAQAHDVARNVCC